VGVAVIHVKRQTEMMGVAVAFRYCFAKAEK